jgi:hypothetical protein
MNGNRPAYRTWLALFAFGLSVFNLLSVFDVVAPLSEPWHSISLLGVLAIVYGLVGIDKLEKRRERQGDRSA